MNDYKTLEPFPPGEYLKDELEARGWTQRAFASIVGWPTSVISSIINGKRPVTLEIAQGLSAAIGNSVHHWIRLETVYQLSKRKNLDNSIARRAYLYDKYPIQNMMRRDWIEGSDDVHELESQIRDFLRKSTIDAPCPIKFAARKTEKKKDISPGQEVWLARAWQLAPSVHVENIFDRSLFDLLLDELDLLKTEPEEIRHIPQILAKYGIRFLVVEALPRTKIDGACFWLDDKSPVITLTLRYDRIDGFWFNLTHELGHIKNNDGNMVDSNMYGEGSPASGSLTRQEQKADEFASQFLLDQNRLKDFFNRNYPSISTIMLQAFAVNNRVHPGIVAGQLHHHTKKYTHFRKLLVKIREHIIHTALTDGYGNAISI